MQNIVDDLMRSGAVEAGRPVADPQQAAHFARMVAQASPSERVDEFIVPLQSPPSILAERVSAVGHQVTERFAKAVDSGWRLESMEVDSPEYWNEVMSFQSNMVAAQVQVNFVATLAGQLNKGFNTLFQLQH